jgi:hypothetical protein
MHTLFYYSTYAPLLVVTVFIIASSVRACYFGKKVCFIGQNGVESDAIILNIELIKAKEAGSLQTIKFRVHVQPCDKRSFVTEFDQKTNTIVNDHLEVGNTIRIKYHPKSPRSVMPVKGQQDILGHKKRPGKFPGPLIDTHRVTFL